MGDLQATLELLLEFNKFYNVDLFQRGIYQLRGHLRTSPKIAVKIEGALYHRSNDPATHSTTPAPPNILHPPCVINGSFVSQTFQILYRNEDVPLADMAQFRLHVLVDSHKIEETLERLDLHLVMELWFSEQGFGMSGIGESQDRSGNGNANGGIGCVSSRTLQLHLSPTRGLHYHLPILFDYFHLAAVTVTVHASLIAVHQPYINAPRRSGRSRMGNNARTSHSRFDESSFDSFFFPGGTGVKSMGQAGSRLAQARQVHRDVCSLLSASAESLRQTRERFLQDLPDAERIKKQQQMNAKMDTTKLVKFPATESDSLDCEEAFVSAANREIGQLCAQNVLLWRQLLEGFAGSEPVRVMLAQQHHAFRVRRFAEAFYVVKHPRPVMANCNDADVHTYLYVAEALRKSKYLASLPPLPVECVEMNGDINSLPVIFEDRYEHVGVDQAVADKKNPSLNNKTPNPLFPSHSHSHSRNIAQQQPTDFVFQQSQLEQPIYEEINPTLPSGNRNSKQSLPATLVVNHVYHSLPQTPLMGFTSPSDVMPHNQRHYSMTQPKPQQRQKECLLGEHRRRSNSSGEKSHHRVPADTAASQLENNQSHNSNERDSNGDHLSDSKNASGSSSRFKFLPLLVSSHSSDNFNQLRRVAMATAARRHPSLPVKLLGYKPLVVDRCSTSPQSNSESLPDLKLTPRTNRRAHHIQQKVEHTMNSVVGHSLSDPALVRVLSSRSFRDEESTKMKDLASISPSPLMERLINDGLADSSLSDCSEQSGWVSSAVSSRHSDGTPPHTHFCNDEPPYPELEPIPLAPPEEFQDPPRLKNLAARFNLIAMTNSPKQDTPPEGTPGTFRNIGEDEESASSQRSITNRSKTRPLSQEELRLLQLLLYEMCRPGQPNPLIRALSHSLYESLAVSLSLTANNVGSSLNGRLSEPNVSHSRSLPCLVKETDEETIGAAQQPNQLNPSVEQRTPLNPIQHRSVSLSTLQAQLGENIDGDDEELLQQKLVSMLGDGTLSFLKAKEDFKRQIHFNGTLYSDMHPLNSTPPYFHVAEELRPFSTDGLHLVVCVHGLDGNSADLRLVKTYLELALPGSNLDFLMSENNQGSTFNTFDVMTDRLVSEILCYLEGNNLNPKRISFVGHSLGTIIIRSALTRPQMRPFLPKLHTFLSFSGPHLGTLYNSSGLVNMGLWLMQRWKKSGSLQQLSLKDSDDPRNSFLYRLARNSELHHFRYVILSASAQDRYVPLHSARIEMCRAAMKDPTIFGTVYQEMVHHILAPLVNNDKVSLIRYDIHHALPSTANSLIGRAAHIAVLDSELFIEKFLLVIGSKYFQ